LLTSLLTVFPEKKAVIRLGANKDKAEAKDVVRVGAEEVVLAKVEGEVADKVIVAWVYNCGQI